MTSRRGFLGLALAAPFAAPLAVTEARKAWSMQNWSFGSLGRASGNSGGIASLKIDVDTSSLDAFKHALDNARPPTQALVDLMRSTSPWELPNRLYGVSIKADGDAV